MLPSSLKASKIVSLAVPEAGVRVVKLADLITGTTGLRLRHSVDYSRLIARESKERIMENVNGL